MMPSLAPPNISLPSEEYAKEKTQKRRDVRDAVSGQKRKPGADAPNAQWKM